MNWPIQDLPNHIAGAKFLFDTPDWLERNTFFRTYLLQDFIYTTGGGEFLVLSAMLCVPIAIILSMWIINRKSLQFAYFALPLGLTKLFWKGNFNFLLASSICILAFALLTKKQKVIAGLLCSLSMLAHPIPVAVMVAGVTIYKATERICLASGRSQDSN